MADITMHHESPFQALQAQKWHIYVSGTVRDLGLDELGEEKTFGQLFR